MHRGDDRRIRYAVVGLGAVTEATVLPAFEHASQNSELRGHLIEQPGRIAGHRWEVPCRQRLVRSAH